MLVVTGEIDASNAALVAQAIDGLEADRRIDLQGCSFLDSTGLSVLIRARQADGGLVLVAPSAAVSRLLEISGVGDSFVIEPQAR